ncbi:MAG: hypothetical protein H5T98_03340 [Syntrophomonadaceae bacterium]|nr:hypothetical protein [Syntrophomonadaceae bacterium]
MKSQGKITILSGPSCVGKSPLYQALKKFYPELEQKLNKLILYNSRSPRPGEKEGVDYYFRSREELKNLGKRKDFLLIEVRGDLQGLDLRELQLSLERGENVFFEGNPFVPQAIWNLPETAEFEMTKVFLSPLSREEIIWLKELSVDLPSLLTDIMRRKLLRRTQRQKGILSLPDLENIEKRAHSAAQELKIAWQFDWIIPNHDGEDSDNWSAFYFPIGDARKALLSFAAILAGKEPHGAERWERGLWPD